MKYLFVLLVITLVSCTPEDDFVELYPNEEELETQSTNETADNYNWRDDFGGKPITWIVDGVENEGLSQEGIDHIISWNGYSIYPGEDLREVDFVRLKKDKLILTEWISGGEGSHLTFYAVLPNGRITDVANYAGEFEAMDDGIYSINMEQQSISFRVGAFEEQEGGTKSLVTELKAVTLNESMEFEEVVN